VDLESLVELIYAAKVAQIESSDGIEPLPGASPTEDELDEVAKKLMLNKLKKDLQLYPEVPIPKGCKLVHPMFKDPIRWVSLSSKAKTDLYAHKFLPYLENWKKGKAGKHAANVYGSSILGGSKPGSSKYPKYPKYPKNLEDNDPEWAAESAALDAEFTEAMAKSNDEDEVA
jgi:hypothetical protein